MDDDLVIDPNAALDDVPFKAASEGSPVIDLDIRSWEPVIWAKVEEYTAAKGKFLCQMYRILCDYSTFISNFEDVKISGVKYV